MALETADVFLNQIDARSRDVQRRVLGKAQREIFFAVSVLRDRLHPGEPGDSMGHMDDVIAGFQIQKRVDRPRRDHLLDAPALLIAMKQFVMAEQCEGGQARRHGGTKARRVGRRINRGM
jgi:hypothetical protein